MSSYILIYMSDIYFYPRGLVEGRDKYFKLDILDFVS